MPTAKSLTADRIRRHTCPAGKPLSILGAIDQPGLGVLVTAKGHKSYVFQRGKTFPRMTIGSIDAWTIPQAYERAREIQRIIDEGRDPREVKAESIAADVATRKAKTSAALVGRDLWPRYMLEGKPKKRDAWKPRYRADLEKAAAPGGEKKKRGAGKMKPGHLAPLLAMPLAEFNSRTGADVIAAWYKTAKRRAPVQAKRSAAMFAGFLAWVNSLPEHRGLVDPTCARASTLRDAPGDTVRSDALEIAQLPGWFAGTDKLRNRTAAVYLQMLLLNGMRREELAALRWTNVDLRWKRITLADKVSDSRVIPLTPYVAHLLAALPRTNEFVFAAATKSGHISEPRNPHAEVLADAGIDHVSIHGLRRSFSLLGEAAGVPAGAIAQVMGHKPSAIAERYRPRSLDALRPYLAQVESFILKCAAIEFDPAKAARGKLRAVK
jgi:integrase